MVDVVRVIQHLALPVWRVRRFFPPAALARIEAAVRDSETRHLGEIRFAVEHAIDVPALLRGQTARERAIEVFSRLRVWDTERNNGVLIYLLLADRDVEIVADRGIARHVEAAEWERICRMMEAHFRQDAFERGVIEGIAAVDAHLARCFPASGGNPDELQDRPVVL